MKMLEALSLIAISLTFFTIAAGQQTIADNAETGQFCSHIDPFSSAIHKVTINQSINSNSAMFIAGWSEKEVDLGLALITPNGTKIDQNTNDPSVEFGKNPAYEYEYYVVQNPAVGVWSFEINASSMPVSNGTDYCLKLIPMEASELADNSSNDS